MKIDPNKLSSPSLTPPLPVARIAPGIDAGDRSKKSAAEASNIARPVRPEPASRPIEIDNMRVRLQFREDKETGIQVVQIIDPDSGKLVRQIPPEEILNVTKALRDVKGLLISKES